MNELNVPRVVKRDGLYSRQQHVGGRNKGSLTTTDQPTTFRPHPSHHHLDASTHWSLGRGWRESACDFRPCGESALGPPSGYWTRSAGKGGKRRGREVFWSGCGVAGPIEATGTTQGDVKAWHYGCKSASQGVEARLLNNLSVTKVIILNHVRQLGWINR